MAKYIKLPPEASDGEHWTAHGGKDTGMHLGDVLLTWMGDAEVGTKITIEVVEMDPEAVANLPDF